MGPPLKFHCPSLRLAPALVSSSVDLLCEIGVVSDIRLLDYVRDSQIVVIEWADMRHHPGRETLVYFVDHQVSVDYVLNRVPDVPYCERIELSGWCWSRVEDN